MSDVNGPWLRFADVPHVGSRLAGLERGVVSVGLWHREVPLSRGKVGIGPWLGCGAGLLVCLHAPQQLWVGHCT